MVHGKKGDTEIEIEEVRKGELECAPDRSAASRDGSAGVNGSGFAYGDAGDRDNFDHPSDQFETVNEMCPLLSNLPDWGKGEVT